MAPACSRPPRHSGPPRLEGAAPHPVSISKHRAGVCGALQSARPGSRRLHSSRLQPLGPPPSSQTCSAAQTPRLPKRVARGCFACPGPSPESKCCSLCRGCVSLKDSLACCSGVAQLRTGCSLAVVRMCCQAQQAVRRGCSQLQKLLRCRLHLSVHSRAYNHLSLSTACSTWLTSSTLQAVSAAAAAANVWWRQSESILEFTSAVVQISTSTC